MVEMQYWFLLSRRQGAKLEVYLLEAGDDNFLFMFDTLLVKCL